MQNLLVNELGNLPQVDWVVEFIINLEEGAELVNGQMVGCFLLLDLA
jgi:hypothetical protein